MRRLLVQAGERANLGALLGTHRHHHADVLEDELRLAGDQRAQALHGAAALRDADVEVLVGVEALFQRRVVGRVAAERDPVELEEDVFGRRVHRPYPRPGCKRQAGPRGVAEKCTPRGRCRSSLSCHDFSSLFNFPRPEFRVGGRKHANALRVFRRFR